IGDAFRRGCLPLSAYALQVSGRVSFEIVQKAHRAGIPLISAVSGVSSLAVEFAERAGITLIGFVRDGRSTVYTHPQRLSLRGSSSSRSVATRDRSCAIANLKHRLRMSRVEPTPMNHWEEKVGLARMLAGGVIMDVTNAEEARIAEEAGAVAVMA